jgi:hypothetical protein
MRSPATNPAHARPRFASNQRTSRPMPPDPGANASSNERSRFAVGPATIERRQRELAPGVRELRADDVVLRPEHWREPDAA